MKKCDKCSTAVPKRTDVCLACGRPVTKAMASMPKEEKVINMFAGTPTGSSCGMGANMTRSGTYIT